MVQQIDSNILFIWFLFHEDIARMWITVHKASYENHVRIKVTNLLTQINPVDFVFLQKKMLLKNLIYFNKSKCFMCSHIAQLIDLKYCKAIDYKSYLNNVCVIWFNRRKYFI